MTTFDFIFDRIKFDSGTCCWIWQMATQSDGYGVFRKNGTLFYVHRIMYELTSNVSADGFEVCHSCDNPPCCNPFHLFRGTRKQNADDASMKGLLVRGEDHAYAKLTEAQVLRIYQDRRPSLVIAMEFNISDSNVRRIKQGKSWTWLTKAIADARIYG